MNDDKPEDKPETEDRVRIVPGSFSVFISAQADPEVLRAVMSRQWAEVLDRFNDEVRRKKADPEEEEPS